MFGEAIEAMFKVMATIAVIAVVFIAMIAFLIGRYSAPTPESIQKQERRQTVIESLTDEQREALGL